METGRDYDEAYDADYDLESDFDEIPAAELDAGQAILSVPVPPPEPLSENEAEEKRQKTASDVQKLSASVYCRTIEYGVLFLNLPERLQREKIKNTPPG